MHNELTHQSTAMESLAVQLVNAPGVTAVNIKVGRRGFITGTPVGEPRASWRLGSGLAVEVWGEPSPIVDALVELARLVDHRDQEIDDLAEALTQANDRQLRLFELTRLNVDSLDRDSTIDRVLAHGIELTESTEAVLVDLNDVAGYVRRAGISGVEGVACTGTGDELRLDEPTDAWLVQCVTESVNSGTLRRPNVDAGRHALLAKVPVADQMLVLAMGRESETPYGTAERKVIDALAASLGSALRLVAMHVHALQQAIMENEHHTAEKLAAVVLPARLADVAGIDAFAHSLPARSVGGDFYTSASVDGALLFAIGDVAGKGLPAAVLMTNAITSTNGVFRRGGGLSPVELLAHIHDALDTFLVGTNRFITMVVGVAKPDPEVLGAIRVSLANAGHSPVLLYIDGAVRAVPPCAPPIGVGPRPTGEAELAVLRPGDWLVTGSDGLLEQDNADGELFGHVRLDQLVAAASQPAAANSAEALCQSILGEVARFGGAQPRSDDQTVFALCSSAEGIEGLMSHAMTTQLSFEADLLSVRALGDWLPGALAAVTGSTDAGGLAGGIELCIHELCINIVEHAYAGAAGMVSISIAAEGDQLVFHLLDDGIGFDPSLINEPDPDVPTIRGYGLMIARQLTSRLEYERTNDQNHWTVQFTLDAASE